MGKKDKIRSKRHHEDVEQGEGLSHEAGPGPSSIRAQKESSRAAVTRRRVHVTESEPVGSDVPPFACYFPAGKAPDTAQFELYEQPSGRPGYTLLGQQGSIQFVGRTSGEDYPMEYQPCHHVLGVYHPSTGQLQLVQLAAGGEIIRMEPRLPGLQYECQLHVPDDFQEEDGTREQRMADNKKLVDSFGSTRRRRQLTAREEGVVRVEKLGDAGGALDAVLGGLEAAAAASGHTKQQMLEAASAHRTLPPHHLEAHHPEEAYLDTELIPFELHSTLRPGQLLAASEKADMLINLQEGGRVNDYVLDRLHMLRDPDRSVAKRRARLLMFLNILLRLKNLRPNITVDIEKGGLEKLAKELRSSSDIPQPLLDLFYLSSSAVEGVTVYNMSNTGATLLYTYICVTALLAEPGCSLLAPQVELLAKVLKTSVADVVQHLREVGATCKPVKLQTGDEDGAASAQVGAGRSYNAVLLSDRNKSLREALPAIKMMPKAKKK